MIGSPRLSYHEGDHVCTLFSSPEEQLQAAVEYIRGGLSRVSVACMCVANVPSRSFARRCSKRELTSRPRKRAAPSCF